MRKISILFLFVLFSVLSWHSCQREPETAPCFPNSSINVVLNVSLPAYQNLQSVFGWTYVQEQNAGTRGLIVVRTSGGFMVYDRNAPHLCPGEKTTLVVVDGNKIVCPADGSEWMLHTGGPIKGASVPPKMYPYTFDPATNQLRIYY